MQKTPCDVFHFVRIEGSNMIFHSLSFARFRGKCIVSYRIVSCRVVSCRVMPCRVVSYRFVSYRIVWYVYFIIIMTELFLLII